MNTLSRAITAQILDADAYRALRRQWSALMNSERKHELTAAHHILYLALLGKDWRKGFTPPTNRRKLENGAFTGWVMFRALDKLHFTLHEHDLLAPFDGIVTVQMLQLIRGRLPRANSYAYRAEQFNGEWPFEAYAGPTAQPAATSNREVVNA